MENNDRQIELKFQRFFTVNFPKVKNFAQMLLKSEADAEDVAQDVFCKLWMQPEILNNVYYKEMLMIIQLTLEKMPKRRRLIFELSRFRGLSHKEIADKLDVSIRTIEHQVYLALIELKKVLLFFIFFL